ncbi:unnamed protein product, partial [Polarella glacialis]
GCSMACDCSTDDLTVDSSRPREYGWDDELVRKKRAEEDEASDLNFAFLGRLNLRRPAAARLFRPGGLTPFTVLGEDTSSLDRWERRALL